MSKLLAFFACVALLAASCSQDEQVAGTDTGNPVIQASLHDSAGRPLAQANLIIYRKQAIGYPILMDTVQTDSLGNATLQPQDSGEFVIEALWKDSLGAIASATTSNCDNSVSLIAGELVPYTTAIGSPSTILAETGRTLIQGTTTLLPPGMWEVHFTRYGDSLSDSLPPLQIRIEDARANPEDLTGLAEAASYIQKLGATPGAYVSSSSYPQDAIMQQKLSFVCAQSNGGIAPVCNDSNTCRIWSWESNWQTTDTHLPVSVSVITGNSHAYCAIFEDTLLSSFSFYTIGEVEMKP